MNFSESYSMKKIPSKAYRFAKIISKNFRKN